MISSLLESARIKLTLWYLLIIMIISILFSVFIFMGIDREFRRLELLQNVIDEQQEMRMPFSTLRPQNLRLRINLDAIALARKRLLTNLIILNTSILVVAGLAGYFLAGKTLKPIDEMVDEQNRFIGDASHELRTPLTSLRTEMEVGLMDASLSIKDARSLIASNLEEVVSLQRLTDNLLELAQSETAALNGKQAPFQLNEVIQEGINVTAPLAKKRGIVIKAQLTEVEYIGTRDKFKELSIIFLDNAIKYSNPHSEINVTLSIKDRWIIFSVKDNGIGIAKKELEFIFDRFYRADNSRSNDVVRGHGLGLSIAKQIVEQHDGEIDVKSKVGEGSIFTIKLPRHMKRLI